MTDHDPHDAHAVAGAPGVGARGAGGSAAGLGSVRLTRRGLFGALAAGVGAYGAARLPALASDGSLSTLEQPGSALETADRQPHPTTTTTVPPTTTVPLAEGEILFPVVVGEEDWCYVLDNFGDCRGSGCSRSHEGVDIMADEGLPIIAPVAGTLVYRYDDRGLTSGAGHGWTLYDEVGDVFYKFFHMLEHAEGLEVGDSVEQGQVIGYVGETGTSGAGNPSNNFHLHFEYRPNAEGTYNGIAVDSFHLLQRPEFVSFEGE